MATQRTNGVNVKDPKIYTVDTSTICGLDVFNTEEPRNFSHWPVSSCTCWRLVANWTRQCAFCPLRIELSRLRAPHRFCCCNHVRKWLLCVARRWPGGRHLPNYLCLIFGLSMIIPTVNNKHVVFAHDVNCLYISGFCSIKAHLSEHRYWHLTYCRIIIPLCSPPRQALLK